jgi:membrane protease YdiL (CAAX protease family)
LKLLSGMESGESKLSYLPFYLYFIAFTVTELLTTFLEPVAGVICHGIILIAILINSAFIQDNRCRNLVISLSLVPLVRIMSLSMPLARLPQIYWYILIYTPLLVAAIVVMRIIGLKAHNIGLVVRGLPVQVAAGIIFGLAVGVIEMAILKPQPLVTEFTFNAIWLPAIIIFITTGFVEELIFRGVLQQTAEAFMGRMGYIYISAVFAILHIGHLSLTDVILVFAIAICFAAMVKRTGSLIGVIVAHGVTNVFLYFIGPFLLT